MIVVASQPISNTSIAWSYRNLGQEYTTFMEMCQLMFTSPYKKCTDSEQFSYMVLWGMSKALTLWMNSGNTEQIVCHNHNRPHTTKVFEQ